MSHLLHHTHKGIKKGSIDSNWIFSIDSTGLQRQRKEDTGVFTKASIALCLYVGLA